MRATIQLARCNLITSATLQALADDMSCMNLVCYCHVVMRQLQHCRQPNVLAVLETCDHDQEVVNVHIGGFSMHMASADAIGLPLQGWSSLAPNQTLLMQRIRYTQGSAKPQAGLPCASPNLRLCEVQGDLTLLDMTAQHD